MPIDPTDLAKSIGGLGSLGRGMQAAGVWAHLPATPGPIAAVPARGCPDGVAIRPATQSARGCVGVPVSRPDAYTWAVRFLFAV
jgi:hypothetical protein